MAKCSTHNRDLKPGKFGMFCPTPIAKDASGNVTQWCKFKAGDVPTVEEREPVEQIKAPDWDAKDLRIARESALHTASRNNLGKQVEPFAIISEADQYVEYIYKGLMSEQVDEQDLPF